MSRAGLQLRRARSLLIYWQEGELRFLNFARGRTLAGRAITCELLDFFNEWKTAKQAIAHFTSFTPASVNSTLSQLIRHGLLLRKNSAAERFDSQLARQWSCWLPEGSFHFITKDTRYVKRTRTLAEWKALLPKRRAPKIFKALKHARKIRLPRTALPNSEFVQVLMNRKTHRKFSSRDISLDTVSQILSLVWGVTRYLHSPVFG